MEPRRDTLRRSVYLALEGGRHAGTSGAVVETALVALIVLNVVAYTLQSMPSVEHEHLALFAIFEIVSLIVFALEYAVRVWSAAEDPIVRERGPLLGRLHFATRPIMVIDFLAFAPAFLSLFMPVLDLRLLRLFRLLRLLKIGRYSPALSALSRVLYEERRALYGSLLLFVCAMLLFASAMHVVEGPGQPDKFGTIPEAMWWAVATLTTVGYGDAIPHTVLGRAVAGVAMIVGLALAALPVGIVATGFANSIHRRDFVITFGMLARVPLFQGFDARTVSEIMDMLRAYTVNRGDIISAQGERAAALYFIVAGEVEAQLPDGDYRFGAGDFFGELALLHERIREAAIVAVAPTRLLELPTEAFDALVRRHPGLREQLQTGAAEPSPSAWRVPGKTPESTPAA